MRGTISRIAGPVAAIALLSATAGMTPAAADWHGDRGSALTAGIIGGLALGALAASSGSAWPAPPVYAPRRVYGPVGYAPAYSPYCWQVDRPVFGAWREIVGYRRETVCR